MRSFHRQRRLTDKIQIVPFRLRHIERILAIERASFGRQAWSRRLFLELYQDCPELFLAAKCRGRIAAYAATCVDKRNAEIVSLAVYPDYRRQGVAQALLRFTLRALAREGVRRAELMVRPENIAAAHLYRSFGFRRVRLVRHYYEDGGDGILMARAIQ